MVLSLWQLIMLHHLSHYGKLVFGVCLGLLTFIFRMFGGSAEGVSYAIIFCNLLVPLIERVTVPKSFGKKKPEKKAKEAA